MASVAVFVGLDYHSASVQVCVLDGQGRVLSNKPCANDAAAIRARVAAFGGRVFAALEACTGAAALADELAAGGWSVSLAHPGYVARLKQRPDKTDLQDAQLLADLERVGYLPRVWLAPPAVRELRRLVRYRQQLVGQRRDAKLRVRALLREARVPAPGAKPWTKAWLLWLATAPGLADQSRWVIDRHLAALARLGAEIAAAEQRLRAVTAGDAVVAKLLDLRGVGLVTAAVLRAEIGQFDRFRSGKQLARFCGLSPRNASSGQRQADAGLVKAGNPELRAALVELAHRLIRYEPRWSQLAAGLKGRGKAGSVTAAAVANRWVRWLHHEMVVGLAA
jgi:transposase